MTELDLKGLFSHLNDHDIRFVVIGGVAVAAHGYVRATEDLDIVPEFDAENLGRLVDALIELAATLPTDGGRAFERSQDEAHLLKRKNLTLDTRLGGLDVVQWVPGVPTYDELEAAAVESDLLGVPVRICALLHLRSMKAGRGSTQDLADLERLDGL